ncbi:hypothetical protein [Pseudomonas syringae group genomosp. 3]|uniref:hypothetical protein n=1 Tax=Pseudomonas syringae group genomosp. 3 TaxID=251701 RepID=UPI000EFBE33D|nr:hypothetical protein [Pseudomonas syringae group genomosp. 3]
MHQTKIKELGSAIFHWLSFQKLCGREAMLSEAYLSQPIGEYLLHSASGRLYTEQSHPSLNGARTDGRPRQIDFCIRRPSDTDASPVLTTAFELKWIRDKRDIKSGIVDDIMRQEALRVSNKNYVDRYLILAGETADFESFANVQYNPGDAAKRQPFYSELLELPVIHQRPGPLPMRSNHPSPAKSINVMTMPAAVLRYLNDFSQAYNSPLPTRFRTTLLTSIFNDRFTVCIWKISSIPKRQTIPVPPRRTRGTMPATL